MALVVRDGDGRCALDSAEGISTFLCMFNRQQMRAWWLAGLAVLGVALATHAYEHWEIAAHAECVARAHAEGHESGGARHDHGCTAHDHAPALAGSVVLLTVTESVATVSDERPLSPRPRASSIDQPPRLS